MARHVLGGPGDEGRASYQIALSVCPECGGGRQQAGGELVSVGAEVVAMADCDGQHLGPLTAPVASNGSVASKGSVASNGSVASTGSVASKCAHVGARAKQAIKPATRRAVLRRDHRRCAVPGCRNALFLDLHHIAPRSEGGANDADNLITLCGVHHRAAHRGELVVEGSVLHGYSLPACGRQRLRTGSRATCGGDTDQGLRRPTRPRFSRRRDPSSAGQSRKHGEDREVSIEGVVRAALAKLTAPAPPRSHEPSPTPASRDP